MSMGEYYPRLRSSLHSPDDPIWGQQRHYIPALGGALRQAYSLLHTAAEEDDAYLHAYKAIISFRPMEMCAEQRLRMEYALALAYAGENDVPQALEAAEYALEAADKLGDDAAPVELAYLAGALSHRLNEQELAYDLYAGALDALRRIGRENEPVDPMLELDLILRLGWRAWELGRFSQSLRYLDEGYTLRAQWPVTKPSLAASLSWLDAQLARFRGNSAQAVEMALPAAALLLEVGQMLNAGRAHVFVAECAIDLAQSSSIDDPQLALDLARDAAQHADALARQTHDVAGKELARLATIQTASVQRAIVSSNDGDARLPELERMLTAVSKLNDVALIGRVETAIGDELCAQGNVEAARAQYTKAWQRFEEHDLGGLAFWPRRALRHIDER